MSIKTTKLRVLVLLALSFGLVMGARAARKTLTSIQGIVNAQGQDAVVTYTKAGYEPKLILIKPGQSVTFLNRSGRPMWPASNPHPYHGLYPAFDPKQGIDANDSWRFAFLKAGSYRYHDHLYPSATGKIIVSETTSESGIPDCRRLTGLSETDRAWCWDDLLTQAFEKDGTKGAFAEFRRIYREDLLFAKSGCHAHAHRIGDAYYAQFAKYRKVEALELPPETVYCGYGFYHGLFEHMFRDNPDVDLAKRICTYLDEKYSSRIPRIRLNCFHGLGHGFMKEPLDKADPRDPQSVVGPALALCNSVSENSNEVQECLQGTFNVMAEWSWGGYFGLSVDKKDPLKLCRNQKTRPNQFACYYEMAMHMNRYNYTNDDVAGYLPVMLSRIYDPEMASVAIHTAVAGLLQAGVVEESIDPYLTLCRKFAATHQGTCLNAIVGGLMAHGEPEIEYKRAFGFCANKLLSDDERDNCYHSVINVAFEMYEKEKVLMICTDIPEQYRKYCRK